MRAASIPERGAFSPPGTGLASPRAISATRYDCVILKTPPMTDFFIMAIYAVILTT
jgi:hypothetical protein